MYVSLRNGTEEDIVRYLLLPNKIRSDVQAYTRYIQPQNSTTKHVIYRLTTFSRTDIVRVYFKMAVKLLPSVPEMNDYRE
jgi:hypothetical protein